MKVWSIAALGLFFTALASDLSAKTFALPDARPVVTIELPDAWAPEAIEQLVLS